MPVQKQAYTEPPEGTPNRNWEDNWHRGMDYIAPDHIEGTHPIETGEASFRQHQQQQQPEQ